MDDQNNDQANTSSQTTPPESSFVKDSSEFDQPSTPDNSPTQADEQIVWSGPEFIEHEKSVNWFMLTFVAAIILGGLFYLLSKDAITTITIVLAVIIVGFYGARRPKAINYGLNHLGISVGLKQYSYDQFRYFTATSEDGYINITFMPLKRFSPPVGMYYKGNEEAKIVEFLSSRMPLEEHKADIIDNLMQRIRF